MRTFIVLFFKNTSPTEIYTSGHTLSYTTLFRSFIAPERGSRLAAVGENLHERAAGFLVVRVEQQKLPRDGGTALALAGGQRARQGAGHGFRRQMAQPLPLHQQPLLETGVGDRKSTRLNSSH